MIDIYSKGENLFNQLNQYPSISFFIELLAFGLQLFSRHIQISLLKCRIYESSKVQMKQRHFYKEVFQQSRMFDILQLSPLTFFH